MKNFNEALGEFERTVLLAVVALGDTAYAVPIRLEVERISTRSVARGAVYITLMRLADKGYLRSRLGEATAERGGRPKRFYRATPLALRVLRQARDQQLRAWAAADATLGRT
jgi:DNA-binding PadR family transcriptional regulator